MVEFLDYIKEQGPDYWRKLGAPTFPGSLLFDSNLKNTAGSQTGRSKAGLLTKKGSLMASSKNLGLTTSSQMMAMSSKNNK